jgi:integrase
MGIPPKTPGELVTIVAQGNKAHFDLTRPLSEAALAVIESQARDEGGGTFVFSTTNGRRPFSDFSRFKATFDLECGVSNWTLHDLRRSGRSLMSRAGVSADIAERCLGHVIGGVRGVYDRHQYRAEMLRAYESLAALIGRIVDPPQDNVEQLRRA